MGVSNRVSYSLYFIFDFIYSNYRKNNYFGETITIKYFHN